MTTQLTTETERGGKRAKPASTAEEHRFRGVGDVEIFFRAWRPEGAPRAVVVISPGFNAHSGQYEWTARQLLGRGLAVYAIDHRGRGESGGERFFVNDVSEYVADLATLISRAKDRDPGLRVFLLGHSAGGVIACVYALDHEAEIDGLICESSAFRVPGPRFALSLFKGLSHIAPHAKFVKLKNEYFSRDPAVVEAMNRDPLISNEKQPNATMAALVRADERLDKEFSKITLPVLIIHGTEDKVTLPSGSQIFFDNAGSDDKRLELYAGHYHDLLNDVAREKVIGDIEAWIEARMPA